jgi:PAS domain S-box-containing protein
MHFGHAGAGLVGSYDYRWVSLSVVIAIIAAYAALDLSGRVSAARGQLKAVWLAGGALAMGTGIWAMHYIGMLAFNLPIPVYYDVPAVALSLLAAVLASFVALFVVGRNNMGLRAAGIGGLLMGTGIAGMHYIGMEAMRLQAMCHYDLPIVLLSVALAVVISLVALWLTFTLRTETQGLGWKKLTSALVMGAAIPVMHYTGMAAVTYTPVTTALEIGNAVEITQLGIIGIGGVALVILVIAIVTSLVDRRFSAQSLELERSEQSYRQIVESAKVVLWRATTDSSAFSFVNPEAEKLLGFPPAEWLRVQNFWMEHIHPDDRAIARKHCGIAVEQQGSQLFEHRMLTASGDVVWLRTSVRVVGAHADQELVGVMTDITDRKRAQEAAEESSNAMRGLLAEIERLNKQLSQENQRMSAELEVTCRLQQMILPSTKDLNAFAKLDIAGFMQPATEVGGDYFDVIAKDGGVVFCIGDVTGHGLESGVIAIMVQTAVRTLLASGQYQSGTFFDVLNKVIFENIRHMNCDRNLTFSLLHYKDGQVLISGQHEEVLVVRRNGEIERYDTQDLGFPIGLDRDISRFVAETKIALGQGDVMVVYTDGITEAMNSVGATYGVDRLARAIADSGGDSAGGICTSVRNSVKQYVGNTVLLDDMSLLVVKPD